MRLFEVLIILGLAVTGASAATGIIVTANIYKENIGRAIDWCAGGLFAGWCIMAVALIIAPK